MKSLLIILKRLFHALYVIVGAAGLTLLFFLVLPIMQAINQSGQQDMVVRTVQTAEIEPPPPPPAEEEPPEKPEPEEPPPELQESAEPLDLQQLEMALNVGTGGGALSGDFATKLNTVASAGQDVDAIFSMSDLDQRPRIIYQPGPTLTRELREQAPGKVYVLFVVNREGRVENAKVQKSSHPIFEKPALAAVKRWKFEPGKRKGKAVRFRMRVPITFPEG